MGCFKHEQQKSRNIYIYIYIYIHILYLFFHIYNRLTFFCNCWLYVVHFSNILSFWLSKPCNIFALGWTFPVNHGQFQEKKKGIRRKLQDVGFARECKTLWDPGINEHEWQRLINKGCSRTPENIELCAHLGKTQTNMQTI